MTWTLAKVTRTAHPNDTLSRLIMGVTMEFAQINADGIVVGTHTYTEPNVSDVSAAGIGKLARDQIRQLELISGTTPGVADDLDDIKTLMAGPRIPADVAARVAAAVADFGQTDAEIAAALNATVIDNPVARAKVARAFNVDALMGSLTPATRKAIAAHPAIPTISNAVEQGDGMALCRLASLLAEAGTISTDDRDKVLATCAPMDDPAWAPQVSRASLVFGRAITVAEVAVVRALAG